MTRAAWAAWLALAPACTSQAVVQVVDLSAPDQGPSDAGTCVTSVPTCPATPPSYQNQVAPIVAQYCVPCHGPGGVSANIPLGDYADIDADRQEVLDQVYECLMPPADAGQPTLAQRETLITWIICHAPDN